jgi:small subunit ribosomal protein S19
VIRQNMVGLKVQIYNGIRFFLVEINTEMIGHCLGEFAPTRKKPIPKKKKKKK